MALAVFPQGGSVMAVRSATMAVMSWTVVGSSLTINFQSYINILIIK